MNEPIERSESGPGDFGQPLKPLVLGVPLTHSDWILKNEGIPWGEEGVRYMLDVCKASGWTRIYWRTFDGGRANYKSRHATPGCHLEYDCYYNPITPEDKAVLREFEPDLKADEARKILEKQQKADYSEFDSLAAAVAYGHEIGLEIHAWISINEDDHAWGLRSDFSLKHPEFRWKRRNGRFYRSQISFAFEDAMNYKLAIVRELADNYAIDGLFIDWIRTGDVRDDPQADKDGVADRGYEEPLVRGFIEKYGVDPHSIPNGDERWVAHRAEPHTEFMRGVRKIADARETRLPVSVMVYHPWAFRGTKFWIDGNLNGMHLDVRTWSREGLIDEAVAAGYYIEGGDARKGFAALKEETEGKVSLWLYAWTPFSAEQFRDEMRLAQELGAKQILFWEADYIEMAKDIGSVQAAMRAQR